MQSPSRLSVVSTSINPVVSGLQGWADLPDGPLYSIVALLGSSIDILAFAATCHSWRAAFFSYRTASNLCTLIPPLLIRPAGPIQGSSLPSIFSEKCSSVPENSRYMLRVRKVIDVASNNSTLRCQIPQETFENMHFAGSSHGHLICCYRGDCLVVDVFTGAVVSPPRLPFSNGYYGGTLTAPLTSPNSHLLVSTQSSLFDWAVGSDSWQELQLPHGWIFQIVPFNGQFIAMDHDMRIYSLRLAPRLGLREISTEWCSEIEPESFVQAWLVVCGDDLLMVDHFVHLSSVDPVCHRLDMSTEPAKWVKVKTLDNWAIFVGGDERSPPFACVRPERWGGTSNNLYYAHHSQPWSVHELRGHVDLAPTNHPNFNWRKRFVPTAMAMWVYPSMFYSDGW
ncbi:hypothetical protein ACQJBY_072306 [Aegilops geniculata]